MLFELLAKNQGYQVEYMSKLSNHLSMTLIALDKLNVSNQILSNFYDHYTHKLIMTSSDSKFNQLVEFYRLKIEQKGVTCILEEELPRLMSGISTSGFHAFIRLFYAAELLNHSDYIKYKKIIDQEIAIALAYLSDEPVCINIEHLEEINLPQKIKNFMSQEVTVQLPENSLIYQDLLLISNSSLYKQFIGKVEYTQANLKLLRNFAIDVYLKTNDFTALHLVTLMHAFRWLELFITPSADSDVLTILWANLLAGAIRSSRSKSKIGYQAIDSKQVIELQQKVIHSLNEHDIKLFYTLLDEVEYSKDEKYLLTMQVLAKKFDKG